MTTTLSRTFTGQKRLPPAADTPAANAFPRVASLGRTAPEVDAAPVTRATADPVLLLLVDGTAPVIEGKPADLPNVRSKRGEIGRWRQVSRVEREAQVPTFALLQTTRRSRLARWHDFTANGGVVSVQRLGRRTATKAGLALAIGTSTPKADLALAITHRPIFGSPGV